jgi:hypothetical protein
MKRWFMLKVLKGIALIAVVTTVLGFVVMGLWNALIPELFHGPMLTFWQAIGLLLLSHILLRGWGPWRHTHGWRHDRWRKRFEERLASMSPEEREKFKSEWGHRCKGWNFGEPEPKSEKL